MKKILLIICIMVVSTSSYAIDDLKFIPSLTDVPAFYSMSYDEDTVVEFFKILNHKEKYLCIGGGCGLNVLTNARLLNEGLFEDIHVFPAANDSGLCFGGAIYEVFKEEKELIVPDYLGFLGREYDEKDIREALK